MTEKFESVSRGKRVAIVGAGPSGIATARYLLRHGASVSVFERHSNLGGQWDYDSPYSAVWPAMHTNTCSLTTRFSDLEHDATMPMFPPNPMIRQYLERYAQLFSLLEHISFEAEVVQIAHAEDCNKEKGNWEVRWITSDNKEHRAFFDSVVIASGRYSEPHFPELSGLASFSGDGGVIHSQRYRGNDAFDGKRVIVAGSSTSGCEIASDIAMRSERLISTVRRSRYVFQRIMGGIPAEYINLTRYGALRDETLTFQETMDEFKEFITSRCGTPDQYGGLAPTDSILEAGATMSQEYLLFIAEDRITQKPWIRHIAGQTVFFDDGSKVEDVDALVLCTGYNIHLPFLSEDLRETLKPQPHHLPLAWFTIHPELPDLYFSGFGQPNGSMFLVAEQQARFIAYQICNLVPKFSKATLKKAFSNYMTTPMLHGLLLVNRLAIQHARLCGFEADINAYPSLARYLLFGPLTPATFRLTGLDALPDAPTRIVREAETYAQMTSPILTPFEKELLNDLTRRKNDPLFTTLTKKIFRAQKDL